ncbi:hypothetical protein BX589_102187 [Paraburkholderia fungorum]|jgi:hypothetical protein|nr:hypothetical protein BX589_102187 [Paraburkholderia fungorum]
MQFAIVTSGIDWVGLYSTVIIGAHVGGNKNVQLTPVLSTMWVWHHATEASGP